MKISKTAQRVNELATKALEEELAERKRREMLMARLIRSKENNLKLFNLNTKGEYC